MIRRRWKTPEGRRDERVARLAVPRPGKRSTAGGRSLPGAGRTVRAGHARACRRQFAAPVGIGDADRLVGPGARLRFRRMRRSRGGAGSVGRIAGRQAAPAGLRAGQRDGGHPVGLRRTHPCPGPPCGRSHVVGFATAPDAVREASGGYRHGTGYRAHAPLGAGCRHGWLLRQAIRALHPARARRLRSGDAGDRHAGGRAGDGRRAVAAERPSRSTRRPAAPRLSGRRPAGRAPGIVDGPPYGRVLPDPRHDARRCRARPRAGERRFLRGRPRQPRQTGAAAVGLERSGRHGAATRAVAFAGRPLHRGVQPAGDRAVHPGRGRVLPLRTAGCARWKRLTRSGDGKRRPDVRMGRPWRPTGRPSRPPGRSIATASAIRPARECRAASPSPAR